MDINEMEGTMEMEERAEMSENIKLDKSWNESGIILDGELDFSSLPEIPVDAWELFSDGFTAFDYHELQSKVPSLTESPTLKTEIARSRTNLKQQLMREQELQTRKKAEEEIAAAEAAAVTAASKSAAAPIKVPNVLPNIGVPQQVLQVKTKLSHPTRYHIQAKQIEQVQEYFKVRTKRSEDSHSAPILQQNANRQQAHQYSSYRTTVAPSPDILSPGMSSVATSVGTSDAEEVIDDILSFDTSPLPFNGASGLQHQSLHGAQISPSIMQQTKNSSSCPSGLNVKQEPLNYGCNGESDKERIKKEAHNQIERKRRYGINDRIKELSELLPKPNEPYYDLCRDGKQNKGTILKSSVEFMRILISKSKDMDELASKYKELETKHRQALLRVQELEKLARDNGIQDKNTTWKPMDASTIIEKFIKRGPLPRITLQSQIPDVVCEASYVEMEDIIEDDGVLRKDAMLYSPYSQASTSSAGSHFCDDDMDMNPN